MIEEGFFTKNYKKSEKCDHFGDFYVFFDLKNRLLTIIVKFVELYLYNKSVNLSPSRSMCDNKYPRFKRF